MSKPGDYTAPELNPAWAHYASVYAACPFMNDTAEDLVDSVNKTITLTNPSNTITWRDSASGRGIGRTANTTGDTINYVAMLPPLGAGTVILIHHMTTALSTANRYMLRGANFLLSTTIAGSQVVSRIRGINNSIGTAGLASGDFLTTTGYKVSVLTWADGERHFWHNDKADGYTGSEANYAPSSFAMENCTLLSNTNGDEAVTGATLLGIVTLNKMLTPAEAAAVIAAPWAWVQDGSASNQAPTFSGTIANLAGTVGTAITSVNVAGLFSDADGDTLTFSQQGTWPARTGGGSWVSSAGVISGTPATGSEGSYTGLTVQASDGSDTVDSNAFSFTVNAAGAVPTITGVSGTAIHGQPLTIAGTNLADAEVTLNYATVSAAQTITAQTETEIVIGSVDTAALPYKNLTLTVTETGVGTATRSISHVARSGIEYVVVDVPWGEESESIFQGDPATAVVDGDQVEYEIESHIGNAVLVRADGTLRVADDDLLNLFDVRIWDESELEWGDSTQIQVRPVGYIGGKPTWIGPDITDKQFEPGDAVSFSAAFFTDSDENLESYTLTGDWPAWASISAEGLITGTAGDDAVYEGLSVTATDSLGNAASSNTFSITVATPPPPPPPYEDVDVIWVQNLGGSKPEVQKRGGLEIRARFGKHSGEKVYPRDVYWRVISCSSGQVVQDWRALEIQSTQDEFDNYLDIWGDIEISGLLHEVSRDTRFAVLIVSDKDGEREFSRSWEYTVKYVAGR